MPAYRSRTSTTAATWPAARPVARHRHEGRRFRQADHRHRQFLHPVRAGPRPPLKDLGQLVAREIEAAGGVAKEFNTIAVDDGIAMGHDGMLYSLPSRELIADSVEYMVNAHCADAMVCISNCDKITPGMLMAAMRPQHPRRVRLRRADGGRQGRGGGKQRVDLIDAMVAAADDNMSDAGRRADRAVGLPDLRLVLGHVHRQFDELPDRGAGPRAARQRLDRSPPRRPQAPVRRPAT